MGFIQGLGHRQGFLGTEAKLSRADLLQRAQIERQRRAFAHVLDLDAADLGSPQLAQAQRRALCDRFVNAVTGFVTGCGRWLPARLKDRPVGLQLRIDGPERLRLKARYRPISLDHQAQRRRLHTPHRQQAVEAGAAPEQGEEPAQVDTHQPVRA
ncbi:hypothetical protein D3C73_535040 [compost metagenome]